MCDGPARAVAGGVRSPTGAARALGVLYVCIENAGGGRPVGTGRY